jgi:hypothetical protein
LLKSASGNRFLTKIAEDLLQKFYAKGSLLQLIAKITAPNYLTTLCSRHFVYWQTG